MERRTLGSQGLSVSALGLGCMGMTFAYGGQDDDESRATLRRALELGITFFDTADMYGPHTNEQLLGSVLGAHRDQVEIATKFGNEIGPDGKGTGRVNGRPEYLRGQIDGSLARLGTDHVDLYYQHRVDPSVPIEETWGALGELVEAGKVRHLGISEAAPETIRRAHATAPVSAVQTEYSLFTREVEDDGVLDVCRELGIGFVPYSPLGRGFLSGDIRSTDDLPEGDWRRNAPRFSGEALQANLRVLEQVEEIASAKGVPTTVLALAWVLAKQIPPGVVPIPGTKRRRYLEENVRALDVTLTDDELAAIDEAAPLGVATGQRYPEAAMGGLRR
ncbi:aldo/keto reductase [Actinomycetospora termitidis]|uniref:Aldo/keto reductase n=1 Tax=Actinomycetospora termitidis TaxID=3053470 RepID=A0ABT7MD26_9PSEU|nr:aldo/keto reductase [Actinomycetospora sp. Odt1-22]MDL5157887.1 aldo/keto reductase [Actinomycetospora sp. Odt1-22]